MVTTIFIMPVGSVLLIFYNKITIIFYNLHSIMCKKWNQGFANKMEVMVKFKTLFWAAVFLFFFFPLHLKTIKSTTAL